MSTQIHAATPGEGPGATGAARGTRAGVSTFMDGLVADFQKWIRENQDMLPDIGEAQPAANDPPSSSDIPHGPEVDVRF